MPATTNPLGVKGAGEAGTTAAIAAVMNAFADAIPGEAGKKIQMPATPEKVWKACQESAALTPPRVRRASETRLIPMRTDSGSTRSLATRVANGHSSAVLSDRHHLPVLHRDLVGPQRREARRLHRLAGLHVERAEVQRALDDVVFENAVGEARRAVGAFVVGGEELAADVVDGE